MRESRKAMRAVDPGVSFRNQVRANVTPLAGNADVSEQRTGRVPPRHCGITTKPHRSARSGKVALQVVARFRTVAAAEVRRLQADQTNSRARVDETDLDRPRIDDTQERRADVERALARSRSTRQDTREQPDCAERR